MKLGNEQIDLDEIDFGILSALQKNCRKSLAKIGAEVGLSAPSVMERVKKLEDGGVIRGYHALLDAKELGMDVTAFIGVSIGHPKLIDRFEREIDTVEGVLECHHVTGGYTLLLKAKTRDTSTLEKLISAVRSIEGVERTETMVVLSTHSEHTQLSLPVEPPAAKKTRRNNGGDRLAAGAGRS
ncbi:MAG: Lrp/AsnC family transcriptional regulator [Candidatus Binatia bacterium]